MTTDEIRECLEQRGRHRCAKCNTVIELLGGGREIGGFRCVVRCKVHGVEKAFISDKTIEDAPKKPIMWFAGEALAIAPIDRHGRTSDSTARGVDVELVPTPASEPYRPKKKGAR